MALVAPYVASNPAHVTDPAAPAWIIDYPNYASQACVIYLVLCFAVAWYGTRLRTLAGGKDQGGLTQSPLMTIIWS